MPLKAKLISAIDNIFAETEALRAFSKIEDKVGMALCRYSMVTTYARREVAVCPDKSWTKGGGHVFVDLSCHVPEVQRALTGVDERWQEVDYSQPVFSFRYRKMEIAEPELRAHVDSPKSAASFAEALAVFLSGKAMAWFERFDSREGVLEYFIKREDDYSLALLFNHIGSRGEARQHVGNYLKKLPRHIQHKIDHLLDAGVLSPDDKTCLLTAALQRSDEYQRRVEAWAEAR